MIKFEDVSKQFGKNIAAIANVSFTIEDGEFVFLVGPSGAGKSTILNLLTVQYLPTSGNIYFDDYDYFRLVKRDIPYLRREIGCIFQDYKLLVDRTVGENLALPLEIIGKNDKEIKNYVSEALKEVGLSGKENLFPKELSGGEVQRVAIARAILTNPKVILADEPTADLDEKNAWVIVELLAKINAANHTTVIMATHNPEIVRQMKKRVITIDEGRVMADTKKQADSAIPAEEPVPKTETEEEPVQEAKS